jgi:hypothetical protein
MAADIKRRSLILLTVAYFIASQATVICIVSEWFSTDGDSAVAWHTGPIKEYAGLSWTPRTHLPFTQHDNLPPAEAPTSGFYSKDKPEHVIQSDQPLFLQSASYFAPLSNKAPPTV